MQENIVQVMHLLHVASWNEDHIAITGWGLSVDIDLQFSSTLVVYLQSQGR